MVSPNALSQAVATALAEDLTWGDVTTQALAPLLSGKTACLYVVPRQPCVASGHWAALEVCRQLDPELVYTPLIPNGAEATAGYPMATLAGPVASLLMAERTLVNLLQYASGIATTTRYYVAAIAPYPQCRMTHTRKTHAGLRWVASQAVVDGGGYPHRLNLGHAAMLKDNHWQASGLTLLQAVQQVQAQLSHASKLVVEVDSLEALASLQPLYRLPDVLLCDNFSPHHVAEAKTWLKRERPEASHVLLEVSGGITLATVASYAQAGADVISTSAITQAAPPIDIGLDATLDSP